MPTLPVTALTAAILALGLVALSLPISLRRRSAKISLGVGDDATLTRMVRAHGNFTEYAPLSLILVGLLEMARGPGGLVCTVATLLVASRALHAAGLLTSILPLRVIGTVLGQACLVVGAIGLVTPFLSV